VWSAYVLSFFQADILRPHRKNLDASYTRGIPPNTEFTRVETTHDE